MIRPKHPYKEIEAAVQFAESHGWRFVKAHGHAWGRMMCPFANREGCQFSVWSTPRVAEDHARQIRRNVEKCGHRDAEKENAGES